MDVKEKLEQTATKVKETGTKTVVGDATLTVGELVCTAIGAGIIIYGLFKLEGNKKKYAVIGGLGIIFVGEVLF